MAGWDRGPAACGELRREHGDPLPQASRPRAAALSGSASRVILLNRNGAPVEVVPSGIVRNSVIRGFMWCKLKSAVTAQWAVGGMALYKRR